MRRSLPLWADVALIPLINVVAAFLISGLVVLAIGESPIEALRLMIMGSLGSPEGLAFTLYYSTNFIFTGLSVALAYRAGLFNIGAEGQAYLGGLGAALVCLALPDWPAFLLLPLAIIGAGLFGALWAMIPGWLLARRGSHIVITTIMFNWIATSLMSYLLVNVLRAPGSMQPETRGFSAAAHLPNLDGMLTGLGLKISNSPLNISFLFALIAALYVWLVIWHTRLGYEIRTLGANPGAADYAGVPSAKIIVITMGLSGMMAGGLALNEVLGVQHRLLLDFTSGYGFVGIAVALMGRAHPFGVVCAALLFGILYQGGSELAFDQPKITRDMIVVIQGLVVLFAGALEGLWRRPLLALFNLVSPHQPQTETER